MRTHDLHVRARMLAVAISLVAGMLAGVPAVAVAQPPAADRDTPHATTGRLAGPSRIATAAAIAGEAFPDGAAAVYLARADAAADALAAGTLTDGPVLLVPTCGDVPQVVTDTVTELAPTTVIALGGQAAVCDQVLDDVADGRATDRLAGSSRTETAVAIAQRAFPGGAAEVYVSAAADNPDAVAAGALRAGPILLAAGDTLDRATRDEIDRLTPGRVVALGGPATVSDRALQAAAAGLPQVRAAGSGRVQTAVAISRYGFNPTDSPETSPGAQEATVVYLARADVLADAVAGGSLTGGPVLLVPSCGDLPSDVANRIAELNPGRILALGGTSAVCDDLLEQAAAHTALPVYPDLDTIVSPDTVLLTDDQRAAVQQVTTNGGQQTVTVDGPAGYEVDDVLVAAPGGDLPDGLIGRVVEVDGNTVTLAPAGITDVVIQGTLVMRSGSPDATFDFCCQGFLQGVQDVASGAAGALANGLREVAEAGEAALSALTSGEVDEVFTHEQTFNAIEFADDVVEITAGATVAVRGSLLVQVVDGQVVVFTATGDVQASLDATVSAGATAEWEDSHDLLDRDLPTIRGQIGPVPVWVTPNLTLTATASASATGQVEYTFTTSRQYLRGVTYTAEGGWSTLSQNTFEPPTQTLDVQAEADASVGLEATLTFKVYDNELTDSVVSPAVTAAASLDAALTPLDCPVIGLSATLSASGAVGILPGLDGLPSFDHTFVERTFPLAAWPSNCAATDDIDTPNPDDPAGPDSPADPDEPGTSNVTWNVASPVHPDLASDAVHAVTHTFTCEDGTEEESVFFAFNGQPGGFPTLDVEPGQTCQISLIPPAGNPIATHWEAWGCNDECTQIGGSQGPSSTAPVFIDPTFDITWVHWTLTGGSPSGPFFDPTDGTGLVQVVSVDVAWSVTCGTVSASGSGEPNVVQEPVDVSYEEASLTPQDGDECTVDAPDAGPDSVVLVAGQPLIAGPAAGAATFTFDADNPIHAVHLQTSAARTGMSGPPPAR